MVDMEYAKEWMRFAEMDLGSANHLLTYYPIPVEIICYHCQQSAEKCLKGLLVIHEITPPKIHDLLDLHILCEPFVPDIMNILQQCNSLNKYSIMSRYPREIVITENDSNIALRYASDILNFVKSKYPNSDNNEASNKCSI